MSPRLYMHWRVFRHLFPATDLRRQANVGTADAPTADSPRSLAITAGQNWNG